MNHAADGLLQAYMDGELTAGEKTPLEAHLGTCAACEAGLGELRHADAAVHGALGLLAADPPMQRARAGVLAARTKPAPGTLTRFATTGLARAAALVLLVAGGAAAVVPGSPLRRWLEQRFDRVAAVLSPEVESTLPVVTATPPEAAREFVPGAEMSIAPVDGAIRVVIWARGAGELRVTLVDSDRPTVQTDSSAHEASFRSAAGLLEILNLGNSDAEVQLPRSLESATIEVNGRLYVSKDGERVKISGPLLRHANGEMVFRTGS